MTAKLEKPDLKKSNPNELYEKLNEFISKIRKQGSIHEDQAVKLKDDTEWILDHYSDTIDEERQDLFSNGAENVLISLESLKAIHLLQLIREELKPLHNNESRGVQLNE